MFTLSNNSSKPSPCHLTKRTFGQKKSNLKSIFKNIFEKSSTSAPEVEKFNITFLKKFAKTPPMPPCHLYFCVNNLNLKADFENNFPKKSHGRPEQDIA